MTLTRGQLVAARNHVLHNVLDLGADSATEEALDYSGFDNILCLVNMSQQDIESLTHDDGNGAQIPLLRARMNLLGIFQEFVRTRNLSNHPIGEDWTALTRDEFNEFRMSMPVIPPPGAAAAAASSHARTPDTLYNWEKGVKRDQSLFLEFKLEKQWEHFWIHTMAQAAAQNIAEVLDPTYRPTQAERPIFDKKQEYMTAVLVRVLQTDMGKSLVRKYAATHDAQSILRDLKAYQNQSTKSAIKSSDLLTWVTGTKLDLNKWNGTTEKFLLFWQEQVRLWEELNPTQTLADPLKKTMLENAVSEIPELRQVKQQATQAAVKDGTPITCDQCSALLLSASQDFDKSLASQGRAKGHIKPW